ncbi:MAG TPA: prepilin-type N-terminal cleavage/methylation domain-containing protein [Thermoanaerobaculaceae bacterium]|nr:prepilin-type N-terminal cleavage/methylation domain-containing protein [Thermoanaerobaculaceae bacterium]HRS15903.1 prepilin-type N-terminal cleavage/methylation domain-containing protein [Thermoanaerobaculaceae bacterium]
MRRQKGFTLIELLIVVAIIGIIAAIAIPNLLNAINRGRQKRTMADIRSIATAVEAYTVDNNFYPRVGTNSARTALEHYLEPTYIRRIPQNDGWSNPIGWIGDTTAGNSYTLWSGGRDRNTSMTWVGGGPRTDFIDDIVYSVGSFVQWPEGVQIGS